MKIIQYMSAFFMAMTLIIPVHAGIEDELAETLSNQSNAVITQLSELKQRGELTDTAALEIIQQEMSPLLDFQQFAKKAMGKHWRRASADEKAAITDAFRRLLENTYAKVLAQYSHQRIVLLDSKVKKDSVVINLKVQGNDGKSAVISYIFKPRKDSGDYAVADIKVEGISMVANYRRQFSSYISKNSVEALAIELNRMADAKMQ